MRWLPICPGERLFSGATPAGKHSQLLVHMNEHLRRLELLIILQVQTQVVWRLDAYTRSEAQKYETVKQNVDALLSIPREQEQQHELE